MSITIKTAPGLYYSAQGDILFVVSGNPNGILTTTITNAGSGLNNGTYTNVPAVNISGTGSGATFNVTVAGAVITAVVVNNPGTGYAAADTFNFAVGFDGGTGTGEIITISTVGNPYTDYKYIADIYVNSVLVATIKRIPQPDNNMGVFNIGDIVRSYVNEVFNPTAATLRAQQAGPGEWFVSVQVKFGEEFDFTEYHDVTVDTARVYFNHYNGRLLGVLTNLAAFTDKVVSNRPLANNVNRNDTFCFLSYFPSVGSSFNVVTKAYAGTTLQATTTTGFTPTAANYLQVFNVAPSLIGGLNASTTYYTVQINGGSIYTFTLTCESIYTNYTIHFLNKYGGFESRDFSKVSRKAVNIARADFGKLPYTVDASGNVSYQNSNNVLNQTRSVYSSQYKETMTLNTDILTDEEYQWLGELFLSPLVYIQLDGYFVSIAITQNNYEYRKRVNDKLTNIEMQIEYGDQFNAQYR